MSVRMRCPFCNKELTAADEHRGKRIRCPGCQQVFPVPAGEAFDAEPVTVSRETAKRYTAIAVILSGAICAGVALILGLAIGLMIGGARQDRRDQISAAAQNQPAPIAKPQEAVAKVAPEQPDVVQKKGAAKNSPPGQTPAEPAIQVEATDLFGIYGKDVVAADEAYTGKILEMGKIAGKVQKDGAGRYYLVAAEQARYVKRRVQRSRTMSLAEYQRRMQESALNAKYVPGIILYLDPTVAEKFAGLGNTSVTVRGKCRGLTSDERTEPGYFVTIENVDLADDR